MEQNLLVTTRQQGKAWIIDLEGDITKTAETELLTLQTWDQGLPNNCSSLVLNFTAVTYINSLGIAVLIRIVRALYKAGCHSFAFGINQHYKKLFRMVGLTDYMTIYENEYSIIERIEGL